MENNGLKCPICGEETRVYMGNARKDRLCGKHADMLKAGEIELDAAGRYKNKKTGEFLFLPKRPKPSEETTDTVCLICGQPSNGKTVCKHCFIEIMNKQEEIDKNLKPWELKDYFYNLNSSIYRLKENTYAQGQIYKLFAIAWLLRDLHKDKQLAEIVEVYAKKIIEKRKALQEFAVSEEKQISDRDTVAVSNPKNRASDGHICKSNGEVTIDDILYEYHICHAYGIKVKEIPSSERTVVADWFIPLSGSKGIYIEYWGMDNQDYQDNREEKNILYKKYNIKLIEIEKSEIEDKQTLKTNIYQKLSELGWEEPN